MHVGSYERIPRTSVVDLVVSAITSAITDHQQGRSQQLGSCKGSCIKLWNLGSAKVSQLSLKQTEHL